VSFKRCRRQDVDVW
jgi:hypothetical protein